MALQHNIIDTTPAMCPTVRTGKRTHDVTDVISESTDVRCIISCNATGILRAIAEVQNESKKSICSNRTAIKALLKKKRLLGRRRVRDRLPN